MALLKTLIRSETAQAAHFLDLLKKIKTFFDQSHRHVVFAKGDDRFNSADCTNVVFDPLAVSDHIQFQRPGGATVEKYQLSDIELVKRLRTHKWKIKIKGAAVSA